jgi:hypothetical protein
VVNLKKKGTYDKPDKCKVDVTEVYHTQHSVTLLTKFISSRLESNTRLSRTRHGKVRFHEKGNLSIKKEATDI